MKVEKIWSRFIITGPSLQSNGGILMVSNVSSVKSFAIQGGWSKAKYSQRDS